MSECNPYTVLFGISTQFFIRMATTRTPLRYPGGKSRISGYIRQLITHPQSFTEKYAEPYAGGAGVAVNLLLLDAVDEVHINDIDQGIFSFWHLVRNEPKKLCDHIENVKISIEEWENQRQIFSSNKSSTFERGFATFYLNRTNRSGILSGGVIGGRKQAGQWKLDARFNKDTAISKIEKIARKADKLHVYNLDALKFLEAIDHSHGKDIFYFIDPPYFNKADGGLYINNYGKADHADVASTVSSLSGHWLMTYDNSTEIRNLYKPYKMETFHLSYSAGNAKPGNELMIYSNGLMQLDLPEQFIRNNNSS